MNKKSNTIVFILLISLFVSLKLFSKNCDYLVVYKINKKKYEKRYGFIDRRGKIVIPYKFENAHDFSEGLAEVMINGKWGFIDCKGEIVIKPQYDGVVEFSEGRAVVKKREKWYIIDKTGKHIKNKSFDLGYNSYYREGILKVYDGEGRCGYLDINGNLKIPFLYDFVSKDFSEGLACVKKDRKYGYIDKTGKVVIPIKFYKAWSFNKGFARVIDFYKERYYINKKGERITGINIEDFNDFSEGYAAVKINGKWGFINKSGKIVIKPQYKEVRGFSEGLTGVMTEKGWGFINKNGKIVIEPKYWNISDFKGGSALVIVMDFVGRIINKKGEIISKESFFCNGKTRIGDVYMFFDIYAIGVPEPSIWIYVNSAGEVIWSDEEKSFILTKKELSKFEDIFKIEKK
jgi:hypothetical protein